MAYISYNKPWESEFDGIVSKRDKLQNLKINQLKLQVHDTYKKDEKRTTNFEPTDDSEVINKYYLAENFTKLMDISLIMKKITTIVNNNTTSNLLMIFQSKICENSDTITL